MHLILFFYFFCLTYSQNEYVKFNHIKFIKDELTNTNRPTINCLSCYGDFDKLNIINCYKLEDDEIKCHTDDTRYKCKYNCKYEFNYTTINCEKNKTINNELYIVKNSCILNYSLKPNTNDLTNQIYCSIFFISIFIINDCLKKPT